MWRVDNALDLCIFHGDFEFVDIPPAGPKVSATANCLSGESLVGRGTNGAADNAFDIRYFDGTSLDAFTWVRADG